MENPEYLFREWAAAKGWKVSKRGWPDFICQYDGAVVAVEVKGPRDGLMPEQHEVLCALNAIGMPTYVWTPANGLTAYPMTPVKESISTLKAYISDLEALVRQLMAAQNERTTSTLRFIPEVVARQKRDASDRKARWRLHESELLEKHGPEWMARHKEEMARQQPRVLDPAISDLRFPD